MPWGVLPVASALHHLLCQPDDAILLLAAPAGAAGDRRAVDRGDLVTPEEMRLPVCTFIAMTLVMVWLAGELWFFRPTSQAMSALARRCC